MLRRRALTLASLHRSTKPSFSHSTAPNCNPTRLFSSSLLQSRNQNRLDIRCLFVCRNRSSPSSSISTGALMYRLTGARFMATRAMNDSSNRPPKETILLDGCDFEHWLVVVEPPDPNLTRDEIIDSYIKTLAQVVGSEEEARMKIYSVSTKHYFAFGCLVPEELSYKIKELPHVRWVLPDSYLDVKNKDYGGEPFINGQAVPYDPKYHALWVKNHEESMRKNNRRDRTRDVDRRRNIPRTEGVSWDMQRAPNPPTTPTQNTSSLASTVGNQNLMSKPSYQNQERPLPNFSNQNVQRQLQMQNPDGPRTRMPPPMQNHPDGQRMGMPPQMHVLDGQRMGMPPQMQNPDGQRMGMPAQMQNPNGQRMGMPPQMQNPDGHRMGMPPQMQNPNGQRMGVPTQMQNPDGQRMGMATQMQNPDGQRTGMATQMQNPDGQRMGMATQMQNPDGQRMGMPPQVVNDDFQNRNMSPQMPNPDVQNIHAPQSMQHPNIRNMDVIPPASNGNILNRNPRLPAQNWNHQSRTMQYPVQNSNFEAPDTPPSIQNQNLYNRGTQPPVENHGTRVPNGIQYHDTPYRNMQNVQPGDYGNMRAMPNGSDYTSMGNEQSRYYQGGNLQSNVNNGNAQNTNYDGWSSSNGMDMGSSPSSRGYQSHEEYGAVANGNH